LGYGFVLDDFGVVADNPLIKSPANLLRIFGSPYWDSDSYTALLYRPLDILSYMAEYTIFGVRPFIYHLDNIILHLACSLLVYLLTRELLPNGKAPLYAALLFGVHPAHTEAVSWVSCRGELLSGIFTLAAVLTFIVSRRGRPRLVYVSYAAFFLGLLSKESAVVAPILVGLYILIFDTDGRGFVKRLIPVAGYAVPLGIFLVMRYPVVGLTPAVNDEIFQGVSGAGRFLTICRAMFEYIRISALPVGIRPDYVFPPPSFTDIRVVGPLALLAALVYFTPRLARRNRAALFMSGWFFLALLPVMNIVPAGFIMAARVMYLPSVGACVLLGMAAARAGRHISPRAASAAMTATVVLFAGLSAGQARIWKDQDANVDAVIEMQRDAAARYPDYPPLVKMRARMLARFRPDAPETDEAVLKAAEVAPLDDAETHETLARLRLKRGDMDKALAEANTSTRLNGSPNDYNFTATVLEKMKRYDEALAAVDEAIRLRPSKDAYFVTRGNILMDAGRDAEAVKAFTEAARLNPENHDAWLLRGIALDASGDKPAATESIRKAVSLRPDIPELHYFLGVAYTGAGRRDDAERELLEALRLRPGYREAEELLRRP